MGSYDFFFIPPLPSVAGLVFPAGGGEFDVELWLKVSLLKVTHMQAGGESQRKTLRREKSAGKEGGRLFLKCIYFKGTVHIDKHVNVKMSELAKSYLKWQYNDKYKQTKNRKK